MANVTASCHMMQNAFPAVPLSLEGKFYAVEDTAGEHMIFSVDKRGKLCLIVKGVDGHNELVNLSESFGLHEASKITALAVTQSRRHLIYLTFAVSRSDGSGYDDLHVLKPMPADRQAWLDSDTIRTSLYSGEQSTVSISNILMGNCNDRPDAQYPQLYTTLKLAGKTTQDIWSITVTNSTTSWKRESLFQMPCNPEEIVSMCIGNIGNKKFDTFYRGLFVLYKEATTAGALQLRFVGLDFSLANPTLQSYEQPLPPGARLLASFDNLDGFTDLVIATDEQLLWRSGVDFFTKAQTPYQKPLPYEAPVGETPAPTSAAGCKQISIAQAGDKLSVWTLDKESLLSYQEFEIFKKTAPKVPLSPPKELSPRIPLLQRSSNSARFASIQHPGLGQKLFVISEINTMLMLQQNIETRMWQAPIDVMIPNSDEIREFMSHTITIQVDDETEEPIRGQELLLCSSIAAEMIINGVSARGSPEGLVVKTDEAGSLTVIILADGIAAPVLSLKDAPGSSLLEGQTIDIDPMQKLWDEMAQVKTIDDLRNLALPDGTPFVRPDLSEKDLQKALKAIQDLCKARQEISSPGSEDDAPAPDRRWGAWLWIQSKVENALDWAVEKIGNAWKFVVTIAGEVWEFIVENFPQVAAAMQKVLEVISKGWEWVKEKFEEIFPWKDILSVKNALVNITTAGVIMGSDVFAGLEQKADECFTDLRKKVRDLKNKSLPKQLTDLRISKNPPTPEGKDGKKMNNMMKSPSLQYGAYHLRHSTGKEPKDSGSGVLPPRTSGDTSFSRLQKRLSGIWSSIVDLAKRFGANIVDLFSNKEFGLDVLLKKVGLELAEDALGVMQKAVTALLGSLSDLLLELADAMNMEMKIPVIGPLYSRLTNGSRLTTLDLVCLLLAIPATLAYKAVIGPLPKEDKGWQQLVKTNAMKDVLDLRMGRIKSGAIPSTKSANPTVPINMMSMPQFEERTVSKPVPIEVRSSFQLESSNSLPAANEAKRMKMTEPFAAMQANTVNFHSLQGAKASSGQDDLSGAATDQAVQHKTKSWWAEVGKPTAKILAIAFPVGSALYTLGYKLPKAMLAAEVDEYEGRAEGFTAAQQKIKPKAAWKVIMKLVFWIGKGMLILYPKFKNFTTDAWTLAKKAFEDDVFGWKFILWSIPGILPVVGHMVTEYVGFCAEAISGIVQTIGLVSMHIDVYAIAKVSYPWYRCPEEYINALAKVAVAAAVMMQGKEPWSLGFAFGLTGVGKTYSFIRLQVEMATITDGDEDKTSAVDDTM